MRLAPPKSVLDSTEGYREEMDVVGRFLDECTVEDPNSVEPSQKLYKIYQLWCEENGERPLSQKQLGPELRLRGFRNEKRGGRKYWVGLSLEPAAKVLGLID